MAAFSSQYHPFLVDSAAFLPNINTGPPISHHHHHQIFFHHDEENSNFDHVANNNNNNSNNQHEAVISSCVDQISSKASVSDNEPSVTKNNITVSPQSSMVVDNKPESGEQVTQKVAPPPPTDRKRRITRHGSSLSNPQSKDATEEKSKKMRKNNNNNGGNGTAVKEEEEKGKIGEKKKGSEEPPTGYIHVRARRGQATDSHSLAERVRREKISERMKTLQRLVPGCDKVTGKALMLDEIINYVQSLQNQVEFLSMKLASVNPMFYDLATALDTLMVRPEKLHSITSPSPSPIVSVPHCSSPNNQGTNFADTTTITAAATASTAVIPNGSDHYLLDGSASIFVQGQRPNVFNEDTGSHFWDAEDQRQKFLHQYGFINNNNLC